MVVSMVHAGWKGAFKEIIKKVITFFKKKGSNVKIGTNCNIGSNVIIKKTLIGNNVSILDGAIIGKKGFGFFPDKKKKLSLSSNWCCYN